MKKIYTKDFKEMAVDLSYNSEKPITQLSKELGIGDNVIYRWRNQMSSNNKPKSEENLDIKELNKKIAKLEVENQILKKALAICNKM